MNKEAAHKILRANKHVIKAQYELGQAADVAALRMRRFAEALERLRRRPIGGGGR